MGFSAQYTTQSLRQRQGKSLEARVILNHFLVMAFNYRNRDQEVLIVRCLLQGVAEVELFCFYHNTNAQSHWFACNKR